MSLNGFLVNKVYAQEKNNKDKTAEKEQISSSDTTKVEQKSSGGLDMKVEYFANDSTVLDNVKQKAYLYGEAWVKYDDIELKADLIEVDFRRNMVVAKGRPDSTGKLQGTPVFIENNQEYRSEEMVYNFNTKKGIIRKAKTSEGEGYVHGYKIKMASENIFYIRNGKYTTCNLDHPHFYIKAGKLKIINNDKIITGPANMVVEDVPTPLAVPFGFFPNQDRRKSGIIPPTLGMWQTKGFSLTNGGYYFAISNHVDLSLLADIYTNGSWSARAISIYKKRYKYSGSFNINYTNSKTGDPETPDFLHTKDFFINWEHRQDPKANPYNSFTASVRMGSNNYFQNDFNVDDTDYQRNEFKSNITYTRKFGASPFTLSVNANHNQNNQDSTISITLPDLTFTMSRLFPLKRKNAIGNQRWYEKIGLSYTTNMKNTLSVKQNELGDANNLDKMQNGMTHVIPISTSIKAGPVSISPGISWKDTWYLKSNRKSWDTLNEELKIDTLTAFKRYGQGSANISVVTKMFGLYSFRRGRVKAMRHTVTPNVSFSYTPDLSKFRPDLFYVYQDSVGREIKASVFDGNIYGQPATYERAVVQLSLQNTLEMKHKSRNDTTGKYTNKKIIDAWNFSTNYDIFRDSNNWAPIVMDIRTTIGKIFNIRFSTAHNLYAIDDTAGLLIRDFEYTKTGKLVRLTNFRANVGIRLAGKSKGESDRSKYTTQEDIKAVLENPSVYVDFNIPWTLGIDYSFNYAKPGHEVRLVNTVSVRGEVNLTPRWKVGFSSGYDFELKKLNWTRFTIYRDLHCWQFNIEVVPFGPRTNFSFNLNVKASVLQDLKLTRKRNWFDL